MCVCVHIRRDICVCTIISQPCKQKRKHFRKIYLSYTHQKSVYNFFFIILTSKKKQNSIMGTCAPSRIDCSKLTEEDYEYLLNSTKLDRNTIQEWHKKFMVREKKFKEMKFF